MLNCDDGAGDAGHLLLEDGECSFGFSSGSSYGDANFLGSCS